MYTFYMLYYFRLTISKKQLKIALWKPNLACIHSEHRGTWGLDPWLPWPQGDGPWWVQLGSWTELRVLALVAARYEIPTETPKILYSKWKKISYNMTYARHLHLYKVFRFRFRNPDQFSSEVNPGIETCKPGLRIPILGKFSSKSLNIVNSFQKYSIFKQKHYILLTN